MSSLSEVPNPFKFLDFYTEADEAVFAGRDREIRILTAGIARSNSFVLYGASGTGKTSLLLAGLFPELLRRGYRPVYVRTLTDPIDDLRQAIHSTLPTLRRIDSINELLKAGTGFAPLVLVFDQLEELFIRFPGQSRERRHFASLLRDCGRHRDIRILISLRQDYLAHLVDFRRYLPNLFENEYRLQRLTAFGARQAIARHLDHSAIAYEQRFLVRMVDLLEEEHFDPTMLQIVCSEVFRRAYSQLGDDDIRLTAAVLDDLGNLDAMFRQYLAELEPTIAPKRSVSTRAVVDALISSEQSKQAMSLDEILDSAYLLQPNEVKKALRDLRRYRLVRRQKLGDRTWYELTHERLVPILLDWIGSNEQYRSFKVAHNLVRSSAAGETWRRDPETLLVAGQLSNVIGPHQDRLRLDRIECEFLLASAVYREESDATGHWSKICGPKPTRKLLLAWLASSDPTLRTRAARAACLIPPDDTVAGRCLELANSDPDTTVREMASTSFAISARKALRKGKSGEHQPTAGVPLLDVLADMYLQGFALDHLGFWKRLRISHIARRRVLRRKAAQLSRLRYRGARRCLLAEVVWLCSVVPAIACLALWPFGKLWCYSSISLPELIGGGAPVALIVALLIGLRVPVSAVRETAVGSNPSWFRITASSKTLLLLIPAAAALLLAWYPYHLFGPAAYSVRSVATLCLLVALSVLPAAVVMLLTAGLAQLCHLTVAGCSSELQVWIWCFVSSCGPAVLAPILLLAAPLTLVVDASLRPSLHGLAVILALLFSFLTLAVTSTLSRSSPGRAVSPSRQRLARWLSAAAIFVALAGWLLVFGCDTVPLWAKSTTETRLTGSLGRQHPDADYYRLLSPQASDDGVVLLRSLGQHELAVSFESITLPEEPGTLITLTNRSTMVVLGPALDPKKCKVAYDLQLQRLELQSPGSQLHLQPGEWTYSYCSFDPQAASLQKDGGTECPFQGTITTDKAPSRASVELLIFRDNPSTGRVKELEGSATLAGAEETAQPVRVYFKGRVSINEPERRVYSFPVNADGHWAAHIDITLTNLVSHPPGVLDLMEQPLLSDEGVDAQERDTLVLMYAVRQADRLASQ